MAAATTEEAPLDFEPPAELDDYVIGRELGRGASGCVYVAEDAMLARPVAIKFLATRAPDALARQRVLLEARAVARIHHPNVVSVYRIGELGDRPYIVSELVRGTPLARMALPLPWDAAYEISLGLARGLAAAHRKNIIHCDLKPANVMIDDNGTAKIIDFGFARVVTEGAAAAGAPAGTPDYMAPELWRGDPPSPSSDVFSLGAVMFELVAGVPPFAHIPATSLRDAMATAEAPPVRDKAPAVDPRFAEVIARCLRRERDARFGNADEVREALETLHPSRRHAVRAGENPYRGLLAFEAAHRGVFFGRSSEVDAVVERLRAEPMVIVAGDSGVGKSSLCRAGVVPLIADGELGGGAWTSITVVPGPYPLRAFAAALGEPGLITALRDAPEQLPRALRRYAGERNLVVVIDQLEELITLGAPDEVDTVDAALALILQGLPGIRVVATVRADFLSRIAALPRFGRELSRLLYFLRPLPPERLRDVIAGPAAATGVSFESDAIVKELIQSTAQAGPGGLPLLSFALADLWEARDRARDVITHAALKAMGGVAGALQRHADLVIEGMARPDRLQARRMLTRLVSASGTRARRTAAELALDGSSQTALDLLVKARLVVIHDGDDGATYELAHEILLTGWGTLRAWLDADAVGRAQRERLAGATAEWLRIGRRADATWQGPRLEEARAMEPSTLTPDERAFIDASRRVGRRRRLQRWIALGTSVALVVTAFVVARFLAGRGVNREIEQGLNDARAALTLAEAAEATEIELAEQAYAAFDANRRPEGERFWKSSLASRATAQRHFRTAAERAETALSKDQSRDDVRDVLADILLARAKLADRIHDAAGIEEQIARLRLYDRDAHRLNEWNRPVAVVVRAPANSLVKLDGGGTIVDGKLAPGSYIVIVETPGRVTVRAPILVERGRPLVLEIDPPPLTAVPAGFVYIPAGEFLFGSDRDDDREFFFTTVPLHRRSTLAYLIARTEVTYADWIQFLESKDAKPDHLPGAGKVSGTLELTRDATGWRLALQPGAERLTAGWGEQIVYKGRARREAQDWRNFPVTAIPAKAAEAYTAWLASTGRVRGARLCTELEWERAARGADGRAHPGTRPLENDDANIDITYRVPGGESLSGPDEVGSHPASTSPFGLVDMLGNAFEWVISEEGGHVVRGGSYAHDRKTGHLANRGLMNDPNARDVTIGLRVCADATPPR